MQPLVTYTLIAIMVIVSLSTFIWPPLTGLIGGVGELTYPWQPWTAVFLHGWPGMPMLPHLLANLVLLVLVGLPVERQIEPYPFLLVTLVAIIAAGVVRVITGVEYNGASAFIWAYAPLLWWQARKKGVVDQAPLLGVMWLIVPLAMGIILALNGNALLSALFWGNVYHLSGTIVGFAFIWFWQRNLSE